MGGSLLMSESIHEQMKAIRNQTDANQARDTAKSTVQRDESQRMEEELTPLLAEWCKEYVDGDDRLIAYENPGGCGFGIRLGSRMDPDVRTFMVTVTFLAGQVQVAVADGIWENLPNVSGNWANWADEKTPYDGPLQPDRIKRQLDEAFMTWYRSLNPLQ